jgi:hypothetical protein
MSGEKWEVESTSDEEWEMDSDDWSRSEVEEYDYTRLVDMEEEQRDNEFTPQRFMAKVRVLSAEERQVVAMHRITLERNTLVPQRCMEWVMCHEHDQDKMSWVSAMSHSFPEKGLRFIQCEEEEDIKGQVYLTNHFPNRNMYWSIPSDRPIEENIWGGYRFYGYL